VEEKAKGSVRLRDAQRSKGGKGMQQWTGQPCELSSEEGAKAGDLKGVPCSRGQEGEKEKKEDSGKG